MSIHWLPPDAGAIDGIGFAACRAPIDEKRPDYRETADLVSCNQCRWAWLVYVIRCVFAALKPLGVTKPEGV